MPAHEFRLQRLFVDGALTQGADVELDAGQSNYVVNVLRMKAGDPILLFNGRDGEWRAEIVTAARKRCEVRATEKMRPQETGPDIVYAFAPLKRSRLDYMVQKATEMGVAALQPVMTAHTDAQRVKLDRMRANVIEAAEQCGVLRVPDVKEPQKLAPWLDAHRQTPDRTLVFCDEAAPIADPIAALRAIPESTPTTVLIGPEGGFSDTERRSLMAHPGTVVLALGPRIMRADTAAVAALTLVNAVIGDWPGG